MENVVSNWLVKRRSYRISRTPGSAPQLKIHQQRVVNHMKTHDRLLAIHGTGSGKTLMSINVAKQYLEGDPGRRIAIFITPVAVQKQFETAAGLLLSQLPGVYFTTYQGVTNFLNKLYKSRHETVRSILKHALIVADEAHYITEKSEKARVFYTIFNKADKVLLMTGTPIQNGNIKDLLPYAKILNPDANIESLNESTYQNYFKCKVSIYEVPSNNPSFPRLLPKQSVNIPLTQNQANVIGKTRVGRYNWSRALGMLASSGNETSMTKKSGWAFNRNIYAKHIFQNVLTEPKFMAFKRIYDQRKHKTIVYFQQYVSLDRFKQFLKHYGIPFQEISGRNSNKTGINNPRGNMVYLLTKAAKEGLDFKGVRTVIFMDYPWVPSNYDQIVGRARRYESHHALPTSERNVKVYELSYSYQNPKTLNVRSLNILNSKRTRISAMLSKLSSVSIERQRCRGSSSPRRRARSASPQNRLRPRPNRTIIPGTGYAVSPGGTRYRLTNLNVVYNNRRSPKKNTSPIGFSSLKKRKRVM
jgi:superfamily II DNA or RNA helicase